MNISEILDALDRNIEKAKKCKITEETLNYVEDCEKVANTLRQYLIFEGIPDDCLSVAQEISDSAILFVCRTVLKKEPKRVEQVCAKKIVYF